MTIRQFLTLALPLAILSVMEAHAQQTPPIGIIDFYGLRTLTPTDFAAALRLQIGDSVRFSEQELRERLLRVPGVADAAVTVSCCEAGRSMVYVGIRETGAAGTAFEDAPVDARRLAMREGDDPPAGDSAVAKLALAMRDTDPLVRHSAMRALAIMAMHDPAVRVPHAPFIELLNSLDWADRNRASIALVALTAEKNRELLQQLQQGAFDALVEMSRWRAFGHALPAALILGRMANMSESAIVATFNKNREAIIAAARAAIPDPVLRR